MIDIKKDGPVVEWIPLNIPDVGGVEENVPTNVDDQVVEMDSHAEGTVSLKESSPVAQRSLEAVLARELEDVQVERQMLNLMRYRLLADEGVGVVGVWRGVYGEKIGERVGLNWGVVYGKEVVGQREGDLTVEPIGKSKIMELSQAAREELEKDSGLYEQARQKAESKWPEALMRIQATTLGGADDLEKYKEDWINYATKWLVTYSEKGVDLINKVANYSDRNITTVPEGYVKIERRLPGGLLALGGMETNLARKEEAWPVEVKFYTEDEVSAWVEEIERMRQSGGVRTLEVEVGAMHLGFDPAKELAFVRAIRELKGYEGDVDATVVIRLPAGIDRKLMTTLGELADSGSYGVNNESVKFVVQEMPVGLDAVAKRGKRFLLSNWQELIKEDSQGRQLSEESRQRVVEEVRGLLTRGEIWEITRAVNSKEIGLAELKGGLSKILNGKENSLSDVEKRALLLHAQEVRYVLGYGLRRVSEKDRRDGKVMARSEDYRFLRSIYRLVDPEGELLKAEKMERVGDGVVSTEQIDLSSPWEFPKGEDVIVRKAHRYVEQNNRGGWLDSVLGVTRASTSGEMETLANADKFLKVIGVEGVSEMSRAEKLDKAKEYFVLGRDYAEPKPAEVSNSPVLGWEPLRKDATTAEMEQRMDVIGLEANASSEEERRLRIIMEVVNMGEILASLIEDKSRVGEGEQFLVRVFVEDVLKKFQKEMMEHIVKIKEEGDEEKIEKIKGWLRAIDRRYKEINEGRKKSVSGIV